MSSIQLQADLTELEKKHAALVAEREKTAVELDAARTQLAADPGKRAIDAAAVTQSRLAALDGAILTLDEPIAKARAALAAAEADESAERRRERIAELHAEREEALEAFHNTRRETHDELFEKVEEIYHHRARFFQTSRELQAMGQGVRDDIKVTELPLGYSVDGALGSYGLIKEREAAKIRSAERGRLNVERTAETERRQQAQAEADRVAREAEAERIRLWNKANAMTIEEARALV